jgi:DNA/RNA-binding domain of Phe-tRNA-synthetase-like protein
MKRDLELRLRERFGTASKSDLQAHPLLAPYEQYDRRFGQNYHVTMQIRSIAQKGKQIPDRNPIIEAMFMTELETGVLASAQDADTIALPITVDGTDGSEQYIRYDGVTENCKPGDQAMKDASGKVLTSISQGPSAHGLVTEFTTSVIYCMYAVDGVSDETLKSALAYLDDCIRAFSLRAIGGQTTISNLA